MHENLEQLLTQVPHPVPGGVEHRSALHDGEVEPRDVVLVAVADQTQRELVDAALLLRVEVRDAAAEEEEHDGENELR